MKNNFPFPRVLIALSASGIFYFIIKTIMSLKDDVIDEMYMNRNLQSRNIFLMEYKIQVLSDKNDYLNKFYEDVNKTIEYGERNLNN